MHSIHCIWGNGDKMKFIWVNDLIFSTDKLVSISADKEKMEIKILLQGMTSTLIFDNKGEGEIDETMQRLFDKLNKNNSYSPDSEER